MKQLLLLISFAVCALNASAQETTKSKPNSTVNPNANKHEFNSGRSNREKEERSAPRKSTAAPAPGAPAAPVSPPDTIVVPPPAPPVAPGKKE